MRVKSIAIMTLVFLTILPVYSQKNKVTVTGIVLNNSNKPVEGATIALKGTGITTLTNDKGEYEIKVAPGKYVLLISYMGYTTSRVAITATSEDIKVQNVSLQEDVASLNEVNVNSKSKVQRIKELVYNVTAVDLKKLYNTSADLNQVLNRTTGIRVRETGGLGSEFKFYLNGFTGDQVKFYMDGIPLENYGSSFALNNIPTTMAERIDIYKGVVPIELGGDGLGGAVNVVTNKTATHFVDASYSYGSFNTHKAAVNTRFTAKNGLMTNLNAFLNYSDNDYKVDASIPDSFSGAFGPKQEVKHFHDQYKQAAIMAEVGVRDKKYADYLLVGAAISANRNEIQQGVTMLRVVGDAFTDSKNFVPSLKYKKSNLFIKNLTASLGASYNIMQERVIDTSSARYDWSGNYTIKSYESGGEINVNKLLTVMDVKSLQSNFNLKYDLNENNSFAFNYSYLGYNRSQYDEYNEKLELIKPSIDKNFLGFSYSLLAFDKRLSYAAFAKRYDLKGEVMDEPDFYGNRTKTKISFDDWGYGTGAAYFVIPEELQVKASYEHAYRLPSPVELLGDGGGRIIANPNLLPESSDNLNLNISYNKSYGINSFGIDAGFIYRKAKDFIQIGKGVDQVPYRNFKNVEITGFEGVIRYKYKEWFTFDANATYQETLNMNNSLSQGTNQVNYLYGKQLENTPILWSNADLGFHFKNVKFTDDNLTFNLSGNYSDSYYLNPPSLGGANKKEIPEQLYYSAAVSYSWQNGRYNTVFECNNITDENLYDYFNVQKPGRSFTLKLRYFFM